MSLFFEIIYDSIQDFPNLIRVGHKHKNIVKILLFQLKINLKFLFLEKFFGFKSEKFFGFKVEGFNYNSIRFLFKEIFYRNEYFFKCDSQEPIIFDCGANIGMATLFFKWLYPKSIIYSFEPDKRTFKLLQRNIKQNKLKDVFLFNLALSNKNRKIGFYSDPKNPGSLVMTAKENQINSIKTMVEAISLSDFFKKKKIKKIDFLKMDIEGSEEEVIEDLANNRQLNYVSKFCIEYHHHLPMMNSSLSYFLKIFEKNNFNYQINTRCFPISAENRFQDILIYLYK
jgi:FkbM family methyltransferase